MYPKNSLQWIKCEIKFLSQTYNLYLQFRDTFIRNEEKLGLEGLQRLEKIIIAYFVTYNIRLEVNRIILQYYDGDMDSFSLSSTERFNEIYNTT